MEDKVKYECNRCHFAWKSVKDYFMCPRCKSKKLNRKDPLEAEAEVEDAEI